MATNSSSTPRRTPPATPAVYRSLPTPMQQTCQQELGMKRLGPTTSAEEYVSSFLGSRLDRREKGAVEQMKVQMIWLEPPGKGGTRASVASGSGHPRKRLSSRQKKELGLYDIPKEKQRYSLYLPLHDLWKSYMEDLLQMGSHRGSLVQSQMNQRVTKADLHGCLLRVERSKCPSYIGTQGIVLQETQNTFSLITASNRLKSKSEKPLSLLKSFAAVPKANSVFTFDLGRYCFCLYGNHLRYRAGERSARKFKDKPTLDL